MTDAEKQKMIKLQQKIAKALDESNLGYAQRLLNRFNELEAKQRYGIAYDNYNDKWIVPKDKLSQETLSYIDRLKEACQSAIQDFICMRTLYRLKCVELECAEKRIRKDTAKEILWHFPHNRAREFFCKKYDVEVDDEETDTAI